MYKVVYDIRSCQLSGFREFRVSAFEVFEFEG